MICCFLGGHGRSLPDWDGAAETEEEEEGTAELLNPWEIRRSLRSEAGGELWIKIKLRM